jgi:hypothetical protein
LITRWPQKKDKDGPQKKDKNEKTFKNLGSGFDVLQFKELK